MTEAEFIISVAKKLEIEYGYANKKIKAMLECVTEELLKGGKVKLVDFGSFEVVQRAARKGHNPHTHEIYDIPACLEPVFKPGKELKEIIKKS